MDGVVCPLAPVMFPQRSLQGLQSFDLLPRTAPRGFSSQFCHDLPHIFELSLCAPSFVLPPPSSSGLQPNGKTFGEILSGMGLRVPGIKVENVVAASWLRLVPLGIGNSIRSKSVGPASARVKAEGVIDGMSGLMTQDTHAFAFTRALHFQHLRSLELHQPGMSQVKRNGKTPH